MCIKISRFAALSILMIITCRCSSGSNKLNVQISLQTNGSLKITGPDPAVLGELQRDSVSWQALFPVYRMPVDTDMKDFQRAQPGKYQLKEGIITFMPDTAFAPGQTYFLRYFHYGEGESAWNRIKNHPKPGSVAHTDLTFKK